MSSKILVVDDDTTLAKTVQQLLNNKGYITYVAYTAEDGLRLALAERPDLVLLDVMVPHMGGWEVCKQLRLVSEVPVIFLTALGQIEHVVHGLESGADDYMLKPFVTEELLARIKAHLRRQKGGGQEGEQLMVANGRLRIDLSQQQVFLDGNFIELTPREYGLLVALAKQAGRVMPSAELAQKAWGINDSYAQDNLKPYIHFLRKKLEADPAVPRWILTVRGVGYRFASE